MRVLKDSLMLTYFFLVWAPWVLIRSRFLPEDASTALASAGAWK